MSNNHQWTRLTDAAKQLSTSADTLLEWAAEGQFRIALEVHGFFGKRSKQPEHDAGDPSWEKISDKPCTQWVYAEPGALRKVREQGSWQTGLFDSLDRGYKLFFGKEGTTRKPKFGADNLYVDGETLRRLIEEGVPTIQREVDIRTIKKYQLALGTLLQVVQHYGGPLRKAAEKCSRVLKYTDIKNASPEVLQGLINEALKFPNSIEASSLARWMSDSGPNVERSAGTVEPMLNESRRVYAEYKRTGKIDFTPPRKRGRRRARVSAKN